MNCNTCRYELSQCLDGRLPSGRRAVVMQHTTSCETCAEFWDDMQAAQKLALQLPREQVGESFREQLWQRIHVGEGTPDAVFREPVPAMLKLRYAFTGAAAAAAVLLFGLWLQNDKGVGTGPHDSGSFSNGAHGEDVASIADPSISNRSISNPGPRPAPRIYDSTPNDNNTYNVGANDRGMGLLNSAQPLTSNLVAVETAKQIEARYASMDFGLRQLDVQERQAREVRGDTILIDRILTDAKELRVFAEVLLEMRDRDRVSFPDPDVGADLRLVTNMFMPMQLQQHNIDTVSAFIEPTVRQSHRLSQITQLIFFPSSLDPREETASLIQMNTRRPEVFTKLFIVIGHGDEIREQFGLFRPNHLFLFEDACGANFVTPRSQVDGQIRFR